MTTSLGLPEMPANSVQPSVPYNTAMRLIDALLHLSPETVLNTPPSVVAGDIGKTWIIGTSPTGAWSGRANQIAILIGLAGSTPNWLYQAPREGFAAFDRALNAFRDFDGSAWVLRSGQTSISIGLRMTADLSSTSDADPGPGKVRWNNATQGSATQLYIDDVDVAGFSIAGLWPALDPGCFAYLQKETDADVWAIWDITAVADLTGYARLTGVVLAKGNNFGNNDPIKITLQSGASAGASLVNFTEGVSSVSPNATTPVVRLSANNAATNVDHAIVAKGSGANIAQVPDGTTAGGDKRGAYATDWQKQRSASTQVASGLHATVGGGRNNTASNSFSTVPGGDQNNASESGATVGGGRSNNATNTEATVGGGTGNNASGGQSFVGGGQSCTASGTGAGVLCGRETTANGAYSSAMGMRATVRGTASAVAFGMSFSPGVGLMQTVIYELGRQTTNDTTAALSGDNGAPAASNQMVLPNNGAYVCRGRVVAIDTNNDTRAWEFTAHIRRGANAAATEMVAAATVTSLSNTAGAATWALAVVADTTIGSLRLNVTGEAGKSINWFAMVETAQVAR